MAANAGRAPGFQSEAIGTARLQLSLDNPNMAPLDPQSIRAFLRLATLKECLAGSEHAQDHRVRQALKPSLNEQVTHKRNGELPAWINKPTVAES